MLIPHCVLFKLILPGQAAASAGPFDSDQEVRNDIKRLQRP